MTIRHIPDWELEEVAFCAPFLLVIVILIIAYYK